MAKNALFPYPGYESTAVTIPQFTWEDYERDFADRHLLHAVVAKWANERPDRTAIIEFDTGREVTYRQFDEQTTALALRLIELGYRPGDYLATLLPLSVEHIFLEYACFKIGVVHAPLDMRLKPDEVVRSLGLIQAKGLVLAGSTPAADFTPVAEAVRAACGYIEHLVQCTEGNPCVAGAMSAKEFYDIGSATRNDPALLKRFEETTKGIRATDGRKSSTRPARPVFRSRRCSRIATSRCKTFVWVAGAIGSASGGCWSTCRRRTSVARAKS